VLLGRFDAEDIATKALLFQAGYITIKDMQEPMVGYRLYSLVSPTEKWKAA